MRCARSIALCVLAVGCQEVASPPTPVVVPLPSAPPTAEPEPAPPPAPVETAEPPDDRAWSTRCVEHLQASLREATKLAPGFQTATVESASREVHAHRVDEVHVEAGANVAVIVSRQVPPPSPAREQPVWAHRIESLNGGHHYASQRSWADAEGFVAFDGLDQHLALALAPIFQRGVDRCMGAPSEP